MLLPLLLVLAIALLALSLDQPALATPPEPLGTVRFDDKSIVGSPGFFRVGKDWQGRWWLIDPDGKPFFYKGVTSINRAGLPGGRRAEPGPYAETVDRLYGYQTNGPDAFCTSVYDRLRDWGFNALGAWCEERLFDRDLPYTETLEFAHTPHVIKEYGLRLPDVFDPEWEKEIDRICRELCTPRKQSRLLIGYFTDNELSWLQPSEEDLAIQTKLDEMGKSRKSKPMLLQAMLSLDESKPAGAAAWKFALQRHGSLAGCARAWGVKLTSKLDVRKLTEVGDAILTSGFMKDQADWTTIVAERYFRLSAEAVRRYDPNHLILGCRFGAPPGPTVMKQCVRPHVDVVSANNYRHTMFERMNEYYDHGGMPILIGEFSWASDYFVRSPMPNEPAGYSREQRMLTKGRAALERVFTHPGVVGYTWYRWVETGLDRKPPFMYGLVHVDDQPNTATIDVLREINARAERIRLGLLEPTPMKP
jgi:hypothetical protein